MTNLLVVDTSAWVEFLRRTGSAVDLAVRGAIEQDRVVLVEPVTAELLMGARDRQEVELLRRMFAALPLGIVAPRDDFEAAADLFRACRATERTPRGLVDCLVVATAARLGHSLLHHDRDVHVLAAIAGVAVEVGSLAP